MRDLLASRGFSLACALLNGAFAIQAVLDGNMLWALICTLFCMFCASNYINAEK